MMSSIGSFCSIGPEALIGGLGKHPTSFLSTHPVFYSRKRQSGITFSQGHQHFDESAKTIIGHDVWIGARSIILDGVMIGDGAVVGANAVVTKEVPPYAIVGGVPAKIIRFRFDENVRNLLLAWKWWQLPLSVIKQMAPEFIRKDSWDGDDVKRLSLLSEQLLVRNEEQQSF